MNILNKKTPLVFSVLKSMYMGRPGSIVVKEIKYQKLAESYLQYILTLGINPESARSKYRHSREFFQWLEMRDIVQIEQVETQDVLQYHQYLKQRPNRNKTGNLSEKTIVRHLQVIDEVFEMLIETAKITNNPCSCLQFKYFKQENERIILNQQEINQLYKACETPIEKAILSLAYGCGLRTAELRNSNIEDMLFTEKLVIVPKGKGNKRRVIPMSKGVAKDLEHYYYHQRIEAKTSPKEAFLINSKGRRMQHESFNRHLRNIVKRTNNIQLKQKQPTIHCLRHSIATHLIEQGMQLEKVKDFLGHSRLETTEIYTHIAKKQLHKLIEN